MGAVMNDRELLELAAKAAGIGGGWDWPRGAKNPVFWRDATGKAWLPLTDDGDALRLACKLAIEYGFGFNEDGTIQRIIVYDDLHVLVENKDVCTATRRAIVRAAAEIGRQMP